MKKIITLAVCIASIAFIGSSCKKSSSSGSTSNTSTTSSVNTNTTTTGSSISVNGASESNLTIVKGTTSNGNSYQFLMAGSPWTMGIFFSGSNTPVSGSYAIEDSSDTHIGAHNCYMTAAGPNNQYGVCHSGTVSVSTGVSNTISFTNVLALQKDLTGSVTATYSLSGTIRY